ncbi:methylenetetrahydrofolate reductase [NAD(P)H] [Celeribacter ethanolicus]|uniref:Methylenetetrahydrofolate reductase n=1 Tax=Celeribacter ethanolicus TaxID=1758178 RepID=A0A291GC09_9RHOB|nr:methylenetetrahydrofolate reductase [NAD(P)H] [Celeribacter ethanolicus]ATG47562.1 methylenetetrahydrofolate reductase [NAD(P)H] [Celeribacter ethanolicus]TNE64449.1 MAG: methylenetetrahydrofolate reductase [NAD(P)H] [Paracoccaceae bacterium]
MTKAPKISFEFFPPKDIEACFSLFETLQVLGDMAPEFVSVTYGAGGTTRELTHDAVALLTRKYGWNVAAHLTCVNATREETLAIAKSYKSVGVNEIVALRGDPPKGQGKFTPAEGGFATSVELIAALKATGDFKIRVGAYPDPHPDAADETSDITWLKQKFEAGADSAITQFFFEPEDFFRFRDRCARAGITGEIIPGILPITSWKGIQRFAASCGTPIPISYEAAFEHSQDHHKLSVDLCTKLCEKLIAEGVEDLHFYTLNRPTLTKAVCANLGVA